jgi:hypothetical protein
MNLPRFIARTDGGNDEREEQIEAQNDGRELRSESPPSSLLRDLPPEKDPMGAGREGTEQSQSEALLP